MTSSLGECQTLSKVLSDRKMRCKVEILAGLLPADQTRLLLGEYRRVLQDVHRHSRPGSTLWLTPTSLARRTILEELLDDSLPVCFAPNVFTFEGFAEALLDATGRNETPISDALKRTLVRGLVDQLAAEGKLRYFESIAQTPGFLDLVCGLISELKRDETWPEEFIRVCRNSGQNDKDRELGLLYERYQQVLLERRLYDAEGRFWSARDVLSGGEFGPFDKLSLVVVDGFSDFTHTQHEILELLCARARHMRISLPLESPLKRGDLFAKSANSSERIKRLPNSKVELLPASVMTRPAFLHIAKSLFDNPRDVPHRVEADGLTVVPAIGHHGEIDMLVERTKQLLLAGVPASEIMIAFRNLDEYADRLSDAFQDAGIPFSCDAHLPLARAGILKAVNALLQLELGNWQPEQLLTVIGSNYFQPDTQNVDLLAAVTDVGELLRRMEFDSGRASILRAAQKWESRAQESQQPREAVPDEDQPASTNSAAGLLNSLAAATERLRGKHTFRGWAEGLISAARELGFESATLSDEDDPDASLCIRDRQAWDAFQQMLSEAVLAREILEGAQVEIGLGEFSSHVADMLRTQSISISENTRGRVLVLDAQQARHLDTDYLFLAGLSENSFPRRRGEDCLYNEAERNRLSQQGLRLGHQSSHSQDEMLLFFRLTMRPRRGLVLSYPAVGQKGEPLFPSPYVTALESLFEPGAIARIEAGRLDPVPSPNRLFSQADLRARATMDVLDSQPALFRAMLSEAPSRHDGPKPDSRKDVRPAAESILAAADAAVHRFHTHQFSVFEGHLGEAQHAERLRRRFPADYQFSATQLESYATCPFRFFVQEILHVEPPDTLELATDYRRRGILVHEILAELHREVVADEPRTPSEDLYNRFVHLVDQRLGRRLSETGLKAALSRIEALLLEEWAAAYAQQSSDYADSFKRIWDSQPSPAHLEVAFGDVPGEDSEVSHESLQFGSGADATHVRGRIDRIDVGEADGRPVFNVIDYKTGAPPRFDLEDIRRGRSLQLALYTLAVTRLELAGSGAAPFQMGYWAVRETGFVAGLKGKRAATLQPLDEAVLSSLAALLEETVPRLAKQIRSGNFPVYSQDADCTGYCPYHTVCRVNQVRPLEEKLDKRFSL